MKTQVKFLLLSMVMVSLALLSSCKPEEIIDPDAGKPTVENLTITPAQNLKYGDNVNVSAALSDEVGLRTYTIQMTNSTGTIYEKTEMLTGKTFALNLDIPIPLPKNAVEGNMTVSLSVKNSGNQTKTEDKVIENLQLPDFSKLYLVIGNTSYTMNKNGNVFEVEEFIAANAVGKIYTNPDKTGLYWGLEGTEVVALGSGDLAIGKETEEYFKVSFNPVSFDLTLGAPLAWNPITDKLFILGNISGHWADGEISTEKPKMQMNGFSLAGRRMWTWTAPNTGTGDPADDMWGNIVAGVFRFKKAGAEEYITFNGSELVVGADDKAKSFVVTDGGTYTIKVFGDATSITKVRLEDGTKMLEYSNEGIFINGVKATASMSFAGNSLDLVPGNYFLYEGTMNLTKDQSISSMGVNLSTAFCDPDVFTGKGNNTWTFVKPTGAYYIRIDAFSGNIYVRNNVGYPEAIYMDGWSWGKHVDDPRNAWEPVSRLCLYRVGTSNVYEANFYLYPWGGDISFFAAPAIPDTDFANREIFAKYFDGVTLAGTNMALPKPADAGAYKVSVDFKDGFTFDVNQVDGTTNNYLIQPVNGKKFTVTFTAL